MLTLAATNQRVKKRMLTLLAREDKMLQEEKKFHEKHYPGTAFTPSAVQQKNQQLWEEAKATIPDAEQVADESGCKRARFSEHLRLQLMTQERLLQQYTAPSEVDIAVLGLIERLSAPVPAPDVPPATAPQQTTSKKARLQELKELFDEHEITEQEYTSARQHILQN